MKKNKRDKAYKRSLCKGKRNSEINTILSVTRATEERIQEIKTYFQIRSNHSRDSIDEEAKKVFL